MGQIQQVCSQNTKPLDSSISKIIIKHQKKQTDSDTSSNNLEQKSQVITETQGPQYLDYIKEDDKENFEVETNISFIDSSLKGEIKNYSEKHLEDIITGSNDSQNSLQNRNRSKSLNTRVIIQEIPPKGILKNKDLDNYQEKRNSTQQKKVRFSVKNLECKNSMQKYQTYKKISFI